MKPQRAAIPWLAAVLVCSFSIFAEIPTPPLIANGSFEQSLDGWNHLKGASIAGPPVEAAIGIQGTHVARLNPEFGPSQISQKVRVRPGLDYYFHFYWAAGSGPQTETVLTVSAAGLGNRFFGFWTFTNQVSKAAMGGTNGFQRQEIYFSPPIGSTNMVLSFTPSFGTILLDAVELQEPEAFIPEGPFPYERARLLFFATIAGTRDGIEYCDSFSPGILQWRFLTNTWMATNLNAVLDLDSSNAPTRFYRKKETASNIPIQISVTPALVLEAPSSPFSPLRIEVLESIFNPKAQWKGFYGVYLLPGEETVIVPVESNRFYRVLHHFSAP